MDRDALAARLWTTFLGELEEQARLLNGDLLALETAPHESERLRSVFRIVHTLKGAARAVGAPLIETVCHTLESSLMAIRDGKSPLTAAEFAMLFAAADALADAGRRLRQKESLDGSPLAEFAERLAQPMDSGSSPKPVVSSAVHTSAAPATPAPAGGGDLTVRVAAERLDALLAAAGELTVIGSRIAGRPDDADALRTLATTWTTEWRRTSTKLRRALERAQVPEATRALGAMDENLRRLAHDAERLVGRLTADARSLGQVTDRITDQVRRARLRPFAEACEALPRVVRDVALTAKKEAAFEIDGADVQADRAVLDALREALLHLVRNAVDHGIEPPGERERLGKPRRGRVRVTAMVRGDRLVVTVADDGTGLDTAAIQARLRERGLPDAITSADLGRVLLQGGLSTKAEVGPISGRGVGLDAVRGAIERIRGTLEVDWRPRGGTTFTLTCPPSLATVRALMASAGGRLFAFPCADVERVSRLRPVDVKHANGRDVMVNGTETVVPLAALDRLMGLPSEELPAPEYFVVITLVMGGRRLGVIVERAIEEREIVLRPVRAGRKSLPLVSGAAPLATGRLVLLLDSAAVVTTGLGQTGSTVPSQAPAAPPERAGFRILVVDDSLTTRALEQALLEAAGYEVVTAVDGAQAWDLLQERPCDLVVSDVEMPRMDGFALCEAIRGSRRYARLPVVLVTTLESPEHRARGLEVGADAYLPKSTFDQQSLLNTIQQLLD